MKNNLPLPNIKTTSTLITALILLPQPLLAEKPIRVFAAASLTDVLSSVIDTFEKSNPGTRVVIQFSGSNILARQILSGASADLFFSADQQQMDRVISKGFIDNNDHVKLLSNELVIVGNRESRDMINTLSDLTVLNRIAIADPEIVPAGVYARMFLESREMWSVVRNKVIPTLNVRAALAAVANGNVDAGLVYRTDAVIEDRVKVVYEIPSSQGPPISYLLGILKNRHSEKTRALYDYLRSKVSGNIFTRFGFVYLENQP